MEAMKDILSQFGASPEGSRFEQTDQGLINTTYFVSFGKQRRYVLQKINETVFPNCDALFHNLEHTLPYLSAPNYTQVEFHRTLGGKLFHRTENNELWRLMSYLSGSKSFHHTSDKEIAFEAGRIIGLFHSQLNNLNPNTLKITLDKFHHLDWRKEQYHQAVKKANVTDLERTVDLQKHIEEIGEELSKLKAMNLPIRVCHNDTKLNNILFSEEKKALCLIDLDTLMPGLLLYDFGDAVRTLANPAPEEETELSKIDFSIEMFAAFAEGMALNRSVFSSDEIKSLSLGPVYMPSLHGLRAYTDFLMGNPYYKVTYPDQNLDRARSLIHFARLAREHDTEMQKTLQEKMM
jgi:Ser/Thr protein kinase RdoA (MazF antagonist)